MAIIVVAGISGAGKTSTLRALHRKMARDEHDTTVLLPQALTTTAHRYLAGNPGQQARAVLDWCHQVIGFLAALDKTAVEGGLTTHRWARHWTPAVILEGFVYDIPVHDDLHIARSRVRPIEDRLADLGAIVVLLTVPSRLVLQRCVCSTRTHRGPGWAEHLERIAATDTARAAYFRAAQDRLRRWVHNGPLPVWEIDTTGQDWNRYADHISQHLIGSARGERTGERCARLPPFEEFCV